MVSIVILSSIIFIALSQQILIDTNYGTVAGYQEGDLYKFKNIPFAQPPLDELRFMPPQPLNGTWGDEIWDGQQYGQMNFGGYAPACIQDYVPGGGLLPLYPAIVTEDCLYLNVFTPATSSEDDNTSYAVMVWIYGGSFKSGWMTGGGIYDPTETIDYIGDVIIVSINYRVGLLGGFYDNMYDTEIQGNQGFMDQMMAIEWVYENIEAFGGDPNRITIYGESAGAHSVALHLLYNNEYISGGIMESPPIGLPLRDPVTWYDVPQLLSGELGCFEGNDTNFANDTDPEEILECWQTANWSLILMAQRNTELFDGFGMPFTPTVDTDLIPYQPVEGFSMSNLSKNVPPYIVGVNKNEARSFLNMTMDYTYDKIYYGLKAQIGMDNTDLVFDYYGIDDMNDTDLADTFAVIQTDSAFRCPVRNAIMNNMNNDAWYYHFDVVDTALYKKTFRGQEQCYNATCHTAELFYIFLPVNATNFGIMIDNETFNIGHQLQTYWTNFAKTMNPNDGKDVWMDYETNSTQILVIADDTFNHSIYVDEDACDLWDRIGYAGNYHYATTMEPTLEPTMNPTQLDGPVSNPDDKKLSVGAIVGIVIGGIVAVVLIAYVIGKCIIIRKHSYKKDEVLMADRTNYRSMDD